MGRHRKASDESGREVKVNPSKLVIALMALFSLLVLYSIFLGTFWSIPFESNGLIGTAIFYSLLARAIMLLSVPKLRRLPTLVKLVVYSFEMVVLVAFVFAFVYSNYAGYIGVVEAIYSSWIASGFFVLVPYFSFELAFILYKEEKLLNALTYGTLLFADSLFASSFAFTSKILPTNLSNLGTQIVSFSIGSRAVALLGTLSGSEVQIASVAFYISLLGFASISGLKNTNFHGKYSISLGLVLLANLFLSGWFFALIPNITNMLWVLTAPSLAIPVVLMVVFRRNGQ